MSNLKLEYVKKQLEIIKKWNGLPGPLCNILYKFKFNNDTSYRNYTDGSYPVFDFQTQDYAVQEKVYRNFTAYDLWDLAKNHTEVFTHLGLGIIVGVSKNNFPIVQIDSGKIYENNPADISFKNGDRFQDFDTKLLTVDNI